MPVDGKISASINVVLGVTNASVLVLLSFILCTSELFHKIVNHIVDYEDYTTIYAVVPRQLSYPQLME